MPGYIVAMCPLMTCKSSASQWMLVVGICVRLQAMDRWSALSQIESGDNDHAVGQRGEVSRYQVLPHVWRRYAPPGADWRRPGDALSVAKLVMRDRCLEFERRFRRSPSDLEFYVLWNAPAHLFRTTRVVYKRARRFANLLTPDPPPRPVGLVQLPSNPSSAPRPDWPSRLPLREVGRLDGRPAVLPVGLSLTRM